MAVFLQESWLSAAFPHAVMLSAVRRFISDKLDGRTKVLHKVVLPEVIR